jgi:acyl carrier protein
MAPVATVERVITVVKSVIDVKDDVGDGSLIKDIKGWDSLAGVNILLGLEEEFDVELDLPRFADVASIREIVETLETQLDGA